MRNIIMHLLLGNRLLKYYEEKGITLSEEDKRLFLLGNIIPDCYNSFDGEITIKELKAHFCTEKELGNNIIIPDCYKFLLDYYSLLEEDISAFGYFYHLYLENIFNSSIFPKIMTFLDDKNNVTTLTKDVKGIRLIKNNEIYTENLETLYRNIWIEFDKLLLKHYEIPSVSALSYYSEGFYIPEIKEVNCSKIKNLLTTINGRELTCMLGKYRNRFIDESILYELDKEVIKFGNLYLEDINKILDNKQKIYKRHI